MDEKKFATELMSALLGEDINDGPLAPERVRQVEDFEQAGMLTRDVGLVVRMRDGGEFQITIQQSRPARR